MIVRDMYNQAFDEVNGGDAFRDCFMVLMALIMEGDTIPVIASILEVAMTGLPRYLLMYLMVISGEHRLGLALT